MLKPNKLSSSKLRSTFNRLIKAEPQWDSSGQIKLIKLLNELSVLGFPPLVKAVEGVLNTKGTQKWISIHLRSVLERVMSKVREVGKDVPQQYTIAEEEHLLTQLEVLLVDLEILLPLKGLNELDELRETLWINATYWLINRARDENDLRLKCLLSPLSDQLGTLLEFSPERFEKESVTLLAQGLRDCHFAGGELSINLPSIYHVYETVVFKKLLLLDDLRGVEKLTLQGDHGLLWLLGEKKTVGGNLVGLNEVTSICLHSLGDHELELLSRFNREDQTIKINKLLGQIKKGLQAKTKLEDRLSSTWLNKISHLSQHYQVLTFITKRVRYQIKYEVEGLPLYFKVIPYLPQPFLMMETLVTQKLYQVVTGQRPSYFKGATLPLERVSWDESIAFCNALSQRLGLTPAYTGTGRHRELVDGANGFRLPFEEEWEFAAKGGEDFKYSGSHQIDEVAWYGRNSEGRTHVIGKKKPNGYGLYDMIGNVSEWCTDYYLRAEQFENVERIYRGGSWSAEAIFCDITYRYRSTPNNRHRTIGLRLCQSFIQSLTMT